MINKREIAIIIAVTVILAFAVSLLKNLENFLYTLLAVFLIIALNVVAKKITSYYLDSEIETKLWEIKRWGFRPHHHFKKPLPLGVLLPILTTALSFGYVVWMACLTFDVKAKVYRAAKRFQLYSFSEMTEYHIAFIAAAGILTNLVFAIVGYLLGFYEFSKLNIYFAFFNMIPLSDLDGNKILFGNIVLWAFLAALTLIGLGCAIFVI